MCIYYLVPCVIQQFCMSSLLFKWTIVALLEFDMILDDFVIGCQRGYLLRMRSN